MIRSAAVILILLASPVSVEAQQGPASGRTHTVRPGETLGDIARQYLGTASAWQRLFEANRDRVADPNRIRVGLELVIPGATPSLTPEFATTPAGEPPALIVETLPYESRRALLRSAPFRPSTEEERDLDTRTVFFEMRAPDPTGPMVMVQDPSTVPAVPPGVFQAAGWLVQEGDRQERLGEVIGFADDPSGHLSHSSVRPYDVVVVRMSGSTRPAIGEELLMYTVGSPVAGVGRVAVPSGLLRVMDVQGSAVRAEVVAEFDGVRVGHLITLPRTFPLESGVHPSESTNGVRANLLAFQNRRELHLPGDFAFIDRGRTDGLDVGDELMGIQGEGEGTAGLEVARFQVVGLRDETATVRIISVESPPAVRPGLVMVLDRKMP